MASGSTPAEVHVVTPDVGGGFGAKIGADPEHVVVAAAARHAGRPVRWTESRSDNMVAMNQGRAQHNVATIGGDREGHVQAYRLEVLQDCGAYPRLGAALPNFTMLMAPAVYAFPKVEAQGRSVVTNTTPIGAYRGAGRPEATHAVERMLDMYAAEIGMDPAEVRRRNLVPKFTEPHTTPTGGVYDSGDYPEALERVLAAAGYDELRAEQARKRESRRRHPDRDRAGDLRRDHRRPDRSGGLGGRRDHRPCRRHRHGADRHLAARAGTRHLVGDAGPRGDRHRDGQDHRRAR